MRIIPAKFITLSKICHGYKDDFYYVDESSITQSDAKSIEGKIIFRTPGYLRVIGTDYIFNNTEAVLASNQIMYLLVAISEYPENFYVNADLTSLEKLYRESDPKLVVRSQKFSFKKPILTDKNYCKFSANIYEVNLTRSGFKFIKMKVFLGDENNFEIDTTAVWLKENMHKLNYE